VKKQKRERQEREKKTREQQKKEEFRASLPVVVLKLVEDHPAQRERVYAWECSYCENSYAYSMKINEMWGHPPDHAFCALCHKYHRINAEASGMIFGDSLDIQA
jgi:hypothetical protein